MHNQGRCVEGIGKEYDEKKIKYGTCNNRFQLFGERVASQKNRISGEYFSGIPIIGGEYDAAGKPLERSKRYPFQIVTNKDPFSGHSRTVSNYWSNIALKPENKILIHRQDAARLGLKQDQRVRLASADNAEGKLELKDGENRVVHMIGRVNIVEGIRPGTLAVSWHYGHWAYGSNDVGVDGQRIQGDRRRAAGICSNHILAVDTVLKEVGLTDPIGGSASFSNTRVSVVPV